MKSSGYEKTLTATENFTESPRVESRSRACAFCINRSKIRPGLKPKININEMKASILRPQRRSHSVDKNCNGTPLNACSRDIALFTASSNSLLPTGVPKQGNTYLSTLRGEKKPKNGHLKHARIRKKRETGQLCTQNHRRIAFAKPTSPIAWH